MSSEPAGQTRVVLCTTPDEDTAERMAHGLVEARLAACVNIIPAIRSVYRWQGEIQSDAETLLVIKTIEPRMEPLKKWIEDHHPYDVPEVVALAVQGGSAAYLGWLVSETA